MATTFMHPSTQIRYRLHSLLLVASSLLCVYIDTISHIIITTSKRSFGPKGLNNEGYEMKNYDIDNSGRKNRHPTEKADYHMTAREGVYESIDEELNDGSIKMVNYTGLIPGGTPYTDPYEILKPTSQPSSNSPPIRREVPVYRAEKELDYSKIKNKTIFMVTFSILFVVSVLISIGVLVLHFATFKPSIESAINARVNTSVNLYRDCYDDISSCIVSRRPTNPYWYLCTMHAIQKNQYFCEYH